jgi:ABC-type branched-subunit amino acid transport system ATPase component
LIHRNADGELQMVAIGCGLMAMPHLPMLDEPSPGLAPILIRKIFKALKWLGFGFRRNGEQMQFSTF